MANANEYLDYAGLNTLASSIKTYITNQNFISQAEKGLSITSKKVGHSNTAITAQETQALYPIKIDTYGHITEYGDAVTIPTIGVLNTTNTTTQSTATNESFGETINLHKISKTGSYDDLLNKPNIIDTIDISNGKIQICVGSTVVSEVSLPIWDGTVI